MTRKRTLITGVTGWVNWMSHYRWFSKLRTTPAFSFFCRDHLLCCLFCFTTRALLLFLGFPRRLRIQTAQRPVQSRFTPVTRSALALVLWTRLKTLILCLRLCRLF
ncbi:hypothetical protein BDW62DRAFT_114256 [Aspergillus aurantiobrunneus]